MVGFVGGDARAQIASDGAVEEYAVRDAVILVNVKCLKGDCSCQVSHVGSYEERAGHEPSDDQTD